MKKKSKRLFTTLCTILMLVLAIVQVNAATPGETVSVTFKISGTAADGSVSVSGNGTLNSLDASGSGGDGTWSGSANGNQFFVSSSCIKSGTITVKASIKIDNNAKAGDTITVTCSYGYSETEIIKEDEEEILNTVRRGGSESQTITVTSGGSHNDNDNPPVSPENPTGGQEGSATEKVEINYEELLKAIEDAKTGVLSDEIIIKLQKFLESYDGAVSLKRSLNQTKVDNGSSELNAITKELEDLLKELRTPKEKIVEKLVEVEVYPEDPFCNIPIHKLWPILFVISLILNVILIIKKSKKDKDNKKDDTPIVNYRIEDDKK